MSTPERLSSPVVDLDAPVSTYRISVDVDMCPADMSAEQACGLFIVALEAAYTVVRDVRINQCSVLGPGRLAKQTLDSGTS
jgi:hypothetical protein